jgi:hypothetical protein
LQRPMPEFGTEAFWRTTPIVYIRKEFLRQMPFATAVCALAHEMAHVVLESTGNPLRANEKAVDLTAMLSGYSEMYLQGVTYDEHQRSGLTTFIRRAELLVPLLWSFLSVLSHVNAG